MRSAPQTRPSFGNVNGTPRVGPLVISEISYNPVPSPEALAADPSLEASDLEFIEIHNPTTRPIELDGWYLTDDAAAGQWRGHPLFRPDQSLGRIRRWRYAG